MVGITAGGGVVGGGGGCSSSCCSLLPRIDGVGADVDDAELVSFC